MSTNVFSDLSDLKPLGDSIHATIGGLVVFNSQYNIGYEVYSRWLHREKFGNDGKKQFSKINLIFVGPSFSDLRDQTTHDIAELFKELKIFGDISQKELMQNVRGMVFNSSRLKGKVVKKSEGKSGDESDNEETDDVHEVIEEDLPKRYDPDLNHIPFLAGLKADVACENLHLIIHDEAHWGIKVDSLLEKFFRRVLQILEEIGSSGLTPSVSPTLLVLFVSATSDVLFKPVQEFSTETNLKNMYAVDWNGLNRSEMPQFASPCYRAVDHLTYVNDTKSFIAKDGNVVKLTDLKYTDRSLFVSDQYRQAARDISELVKANKRVRLDDIKLRSPAHCALASLLCCDKLARIYDWNYLQCGYQTQAFRNRIVLVRVGSIIDASKLATSVIESFGPSLPFEVISLGGSGNIDEQLSEKGRVYLEDKWGEIVNANSRVASLQHIPTLLIVVKKLQMGERLPSSCCYYDVRVPYRGSYNAVTTGSLTQFVQDVGRLAGHKKASAMPTVFLALLADDCAPSSSECCVKSGPIPQFVSTHSLLTHGMGLPTKFHTENTKNKRVYTKLLQYSILLNASPQIGKTGSFLAVIEIIAKKHIVNGAYVPPPSVGDTTCHPVQLFSFGDDDIGDLNGSFAERCKYLRYLLDTHGITRLKEVLSGTYFEEYHRMLLSSRVESQRNTNDLLVVNILIELCTELSQVSWKILDCGCGIHGLAPSLNAMLKAGNPRKIHKLARVDVCGVDLDESITGCVPTPHECLTFRPCVSDFLSVPVDADGYDMVVFNCSLWQKSNFAVLSWANHNLRPHGHLVIVELKRRLPKNWKDDMLAMGWLIPTTFVQFQFSVIECDPYIMSVWQKADADELHAECDLLMKKY